MFALYMRRGIKHKRSLSIFLPKNVSKPLTRCDDLGLRDVATITGMSAATLSRLENEELPDLQTFLVLAA